MTSSSILCYPKRHKRHGYYVLQTLFGVGEVGIDWDGKGPEDLSGEVPFRWVCEHHRGPEPLINQETMIQSSGTQNRIQLIQIIA